MNSEGRCGSFVCLPTTATLSSGSGVGVVMCSPPPVLSWFGRCSGFPSCQGYSCQVEQPLVWDPGLFLGASDRVCGLISYSMHEAGCTALGQEARVQGGSGAVPTCPGLIHICFKGLFPPTLQAQDSASGPLHLHLPGLGSWQAWKCVLHMSLSCPGFHFQSENVQFNDAWMLCWELVCLSDGSRL